MPSDPFDDLADTIVGLSRREGKRAAVATARTLRFRVTDLDPLTFTRGEMILTEDDEDVVINTLPVEELVIDDMLEVREDDDGYTVTGVVA